MPDVITEYQKWKQQGEDLRVQARQAMETRFRDLLTEAVQIAEMYKADFGPALKPPPGVTAFRYKAAVKGKAKKSAKPAAKAAPVAAPAAAPAKANPKVAGLQKKLATARKKLEDAKAGGATTRPYEDKVYELEDELRLAQA
ncbi:MAG: hypothetical protein ABI806_27920 [Candidatus Solibacter sp.]